ncbi:MAG: hypothetical protein ACXWQO_00570, partial [Bdellovibrionota bacterium]
TVQAYQKAMLENQELREQIKAYEILKDDYLAKDAKPEDVEMYQKLVQRLDLLGGETKGEREKLESQARELKEKEGALNNYQSMMKNVIQANMVAQGRMHQKDKAIVEKENDISSLNQALVEKTQELTKSEEEIAKNNLQIVSVKTKLEQSIKEINYAYRSKKKSQQAKEAEIARLKSESETKIASLQQKNQQSAKQLKEAEETVANKDRELEKAIEGIRERETKLTEVVEKAKRDREAKLALLKRQQADFEKELSATKLSSEAKLRKQRAYLAQVEKDREQTDGQLKEAQANLEGAQSHLRGLQENYQRSLASLAHSNETLKQDLHDSISKKAQRRKLAQRIHSRLAQAGINASVDPESGEVSVQFMKEYFDYGKSELKPEMREQLAKLFPAYTAALFEGPDAKIISNVDIIGFASPTFRGKFVNPDSLSPKDRAAVNFNMDISYRRAKAIFGYVFNTSVMTYPHQKDLLPLVRVTGRSYLTEIKDLGREPGSISKPAQEYCQTNDCQKSQKVIIKFNLKEE